MDISVNKSATKYLQRQFEEWYSDEVMKKLDRRNIEDLGEEELHVQPINFGMMTRWDLTMSLTTQAMRVMNSKASVTCLTATPQTKTADF